MKIKKLISKILVLTILSAPYISSGAVEYGYETAGGFVYEKGTNTITQYIGTTGICEIPEGVEVIGLQKLKSEKAPITKLIINRGVTFKISLSGEIQKFDSLKEVVLKEGVTEIPYEAFKSCNALEKITIPSTVTEIGEEALSQCKLLKSIELPEGLKAISDLAFSHLPSLSGDVSIPNSVTEMGYGVFSYCGDLDKVHIPDNATYTGSKEADWFYFTNIKEINIPDTILENPVCEFNADKITFNSDMTVAIYDAVKNSAWYRNTYLKENSDNDGFDIAENTILHYTGTEKKPVVPSGITAIADNAFAYTDIDTVELPASLKTIGKAAFYCSTIKDILIPKYVKSIGDGAFDWCPLLEEITFEGTPEIGLNAVVITDTLTEDKLIFKNGEGSTKQQILDNGTAEYGMTAFYKMLNTNRKKLGLDEVAAPKNVGKVSEAAEKPNSTCTLSDNEEHTDPKATDKPYALPKTLTINSDMSVKVNDTAVNFPDAKPFIDENDRTQIPIRAVAEFLDCMVEWNNDTKTAAITNKSGDTIKITMNSDVMAKNGETVRMDTAAIIKDERIYIPVRFVAEAMGLNVKWVE